MPIQTQFPTSFFNTRNSSGIQPTVISGPLTFDLTLGPEQIANGNMEAGDPPAGWAAGSNTILRSVVDERTGGSGAVSLEVENNATDRALATQNVSITPDEWYAFQPWQRRGTSNSGTRASNIGTLQSGPGNITTDWSLIPGTGRATGDTTTITLQNAQAILGRTSRYDDVSLKKIDRASMFDVYNVSFVDGSGSVAITRVPLTQCGVTHYIDADNFLIAYLNGAGNLELVKYIGGTSSMLASVVVTYSAGAALKLNRNGNNYDVTYNGVQLIAATEIADAVLATATKWGAFSTWAENSLTNLIIQPN